MRVLNRRFAAGVSFAVWCLAPAAFAQSTSVDAEKPAPAAPVKPPVAQKIVKPPEPVIPPRPLSTTVTYPEQGQGEQEVVLELTVSKQGLVTATRVVSGDALFAASAVEASKNWVFDPATRGGLPVAAKIRFAVNFVPPHDEPAPETPSEPPAPIPKADAKPAAPQHEILVVGQREPIRQTLGHADVHDMPGAFGDPYRAIEALPGVVPIASGLPYFYVRGAPPGNVGYFFDGIPVPYLYHFAAGPGVLNPGFVDHVDLYPGAYPARYGRFAGAIVAGEMAPPSYKVRGEASIRLIDSGAMIEAPFASGRGSAMLGGRYSYTGAVLSLIVPNVTVNYWDYQGRVRYEVDAKNSVELLSFGAGDFLADEENVSVLDPPQGNTPFSTSHEEKRRNTLVDVGFHRLDLRWDHRLEAGNWRNALMLGLDRTGGDNGNVTVRNRMVGLRSEYSQKLEERVTVRAGGDALFESLNQQIDNHDLNSSTDGSTFNDSASNNGPSAFAFTPARRDFTAGGWADTVLGIAPGLDVTPGIRADLFVSGGTAALGIDPRLSVHLALSKKLSLTNGVALVHQAPSFVVPVPGFKPSLAGGLQTAVQTSMGVSYSLPAGFESSFSVFQNAFFNMTDIISLVQLENTSSNRNNGDGSNSSSNVLDRRTTGHSYGAEMMIRRSLSRRVGGFLSYTLSRSLRYAGNVSGPATTDRTHVLNLALSGDLGRNWRLGARWLFYSGIPTHVAYLEAARNPPRTPPFWRADFKIQKRWYIKQPTAWWGLALEVLNTTLNKEVLQGDCNAFDCAYQSFGPVTVPSIGAEGAF